MAPKDQAEIAFLSKVAWLDSLARRKWHQGLGRMKRLVELLGLENYVWGADRPLYLHIAGTNGKGSVTAFTKSLLLSHGFPTGAAFSPYVDDFRERVQFGSSPLPFADYLDSMTQLEEADQVLVASAFEGASAFELKTALGFLIWKDNGARAVALEVGMGGRLDASNVVVPAASIIVSIGWDHKEVLGSTLAQIGYEKAGIIKPGLPLALGRTPLEAEDVILKVARDRESPVWQADKEIQIVHGPGAFDLHLPSGSFLGLTPRLYGDIQQHNAALAIAGAALAGVALDREKTAQAIAETVLPGRFEEARIGAVPLILDGAHNEAAARNLAENLKRRFPGQKIGLLLSMLQGHDPLEFLLPLDGVFDRAVAVTGTSPRGRQADELLPALSQIGLTGQTAPDRQTALTMLKVAGCDAICATGSFYGLTLVREAAARLTA